MHIYPAQTKQGPHFDSIKSASTNKQVYAIHDAMTGARSRSTLQDMSNDTGPAYLSGNSGNLVGAISSIGCIAFILVVLQQHS